MTSQEFTSGIVTGILSSILFNPIDKLIFTSCINNQSIYNKNSWCNLYKGTFNTICTRIITSGLYFSFLDHYSKKTENKFEVAGVTALICSITNPIQLVKYNSWYNNQSSLNTFNQIFRCHYRSFQLIVKIYFKKTM